MSFTFERCASGQFVIVGLSLSETAELSALDGNSPVAADGRRVNWEFEGAPRTDCERRWLALYSKYERALAERKLGVMTAIS